MKLYVGLALIGMYLAGACFFVRLYVYQLKTGKDILNPRYIVAGIIASVTLALTSLVAMLT